MSSAEFEIAFLCGVIPALFWLWFWSKEDRQNPEPLWLMAIAFLAGMLVVPVALPLQKIALEIYSGDNLVFVWVIIEEVLKYAAALIVVLWHQEVDEPIDVIMYMIAIALGFAALENALFIFKPLAAGDIEASIVTGLFRFLGATLLHVLASASVGVMLALAFYKSQTAKFIYGTIGLFIAIVLHALFNFFIMDGSGETILGVFLFVWVGIIVLFFLFEKIKLMDGHHNRNNRTLV